MADDIPDDRFLWLEELDSPRALEWVRAQNARSLAELEGDPRYPELHRAALAVATAEDRIPYPQFLGRMLVNFWQDETHIRGLWRRTTLDSFASAAPRWETLLDLDALAAAERRNWVFQGAICLPPDGRRCLLALSDGGKDAVEMREFDLDKAEFVADGFGLPEGKQSALWLDPDTLLLAREWGPGTMTPAGYPFILKRLRRGAPLGDADELFRGAPEDVSVRANVLRDPDGPMRGILLARALNFFENERHLVADGESVPLAMPKKASFRAFVSGQLVFTLEEAWKPPSGPTCPSGALVSLDLAALLANRGAAPPVLIYAPGSREAIEDVAATASCLVATIYRNVQGSAVAFRFGETGWVAAPLAVPQNASVHLVAASDCEDRAFLDVASFLVPNSLWLAEPGKGAAAPIKSLPARFDAAGATVEQLAATSPDGTLVPYFLVRPAAMAAAGGAPTLLYGYGGFQISLTPAYAGAIGKLWIERGGVYAVANIRGGGEFGPGWHQAALKSDRPRAFADFIAVAEDLIRRGITTPRRLGIMGGSNGGLLMGAVMVERPELFRAVVIQVPLLDMLRYHRLLAGASWIAEYGDPDRPEEALFLRRLSPYHNLRPGAAYPEPFFVTSTKDDRVHPAHARKTAAKMAAMGLPFLYYENVEGGHSAAANQHERARRVALEFTYLARRLMDG